MIRVELNSPEQQLDFGRALAQWLTGPALVFLHGDLGTGKTTLVRGLLQGLGHPGPVRSPTFTLIEPYELGGRTVFHLDLYRLGAPEELEYLGLRDLLDERDLMLVEWAERGQAALPVPDLVICLEHRGDGRLLLLTGRTPRGQAVVAAMASETTSNQGFGKPD
ncbi:tRNA (adenosine(37)-N6)-threonylcarbamoyltransferase complex ATPase subunit type 1 TsaE [Thioalkalicoccus limnaeus]|uniref:tRNA threonylcarbamoyladenosine biosynthesis protein TsaE n=1 Tax=Thioalkalicoccus limnaeus TaxID=120681 RepID=A0ABV4BEE5_9GAMM